MPPFFVFFFSFSMILPDWMQFKNHLQTECQDEKASSATITFRQYNFYKYFFFWHENCPVINKLVKLIEALNKLSFDIFFSRSAWFYVRVTKSYACHFSDNFRIYWRRHSFCLRFEFSVTKINFSWQWQIKFYLKNAQLLFISNAQCILKCTCISSFRVADMKHF